MHFGSEFILANDEEEYESVSEEEFEKGMHVSESSSSDSDHSHDLPARSIQRQHGGAHPAKKKKLQSVKYHWRKKFGEKKEPECEDRAIQVTASETTTRRRFRRADTNVVSVNFDTLLSPGNMYAGDTTPCPQCMAVLSHISQLLEEDGQKAWRCEFCGELVPVDLEPEEIPTAEDVTYLLTTAPSTANSSLGGQDRSLVIFCVDTSGSMCVTSEISGKIKLRGTNQLRRLQSFQEDSADQFLPSQRDRRVTYVSRLQAVQAAVDSQLAEMALKHPERRVALVAFNNEVTLMGDGTGQGVVVAGDKLKNIDKLREVAQESTLPQAIRTTRSVLGDKVYSLEEGGATALGPALALSVNLAAAHPGSKVILCTDGKANIGLGRLENDGDDGGEDSDDQALDFYTNMADEALEKGVTVSVITIQGTDCKLVHLGTLADKTGGQVNIVDPLKLTEEFGNILADPIIATKVKATLLLHKELYVVDDTDSDKQVSRAEQNIGNVKKSTTITFEFAKRRRSTEITKADAIKDKNMDTEMTKAAPSITKTSDSNETSMVTAEGATASTSGADSNPASLREFPFQLQVEYIDTEGNKALRVITRNMPATSDRKVTEEAINLEVLGAHAAKKSADLALQGQYSRSRGVALMNQRLAWRQVHSKDAPKDKKSTYKNIYSKIKNMENFVQQRQMREISEYGRTRSDSSDDNDDDEGPICFARPLALDGVPDVEPVVNPPSVPELPQRAQNSAPLLGRMKPKKKGMFRSFTASKQKKMHQQRSSEMEDSMANMMFHFRSTGANEISSSEQRQPLPSPQVSSTSTESRGAQGDIKSKAKISTKHSDSKSNE